jgi:hypothetical protein
VASKLRPWSRFLLEWSFMTQKTGHLTVLWHSFIFLRWRNTSIHTEPNKFSSFSPIKWVSLTGTLILFPHKCLHFRSNLFLRDSLPKFSFSHRGIIREKQNLWNQTTSVFTLCRNWVMYDTEFYVKVSTVLYIYICIYIYTVYIYNQSQSQEIIAVCRGSKPLAW